jgi:carbonic anhydrase/acetyltransferase-like protein (isoleucine patch superfamily)
VIAAGAVVVEGMKVPARSVVMGIPGKVVRAATVDEVARTRAINARYLELARRYAEGRVDRPYGG